MRINTDVNKVNLNLNLESEREFAFRFNATICHGLNESQISIKQ